MKNLFILLFVLFIFTGCYFPEEVTYDWIIPENIKSVEEAQVFIGTVSYGYSAEPQLPDETYKNLSGDCEDSSMLFAHILKEKLGKKAYICFGELSGDAHVWVYCEDKYYEATDSGREILDMSDYKREDIVTYEFRLKEILYSRL